VDNQAGILHLSASRSWDQYGYEGFYGDALLATVNFLPVHGGDSKLDLSYVELRYNQGFEGSEVPLLPVGQESGWLKVNQGATINGRIYLEGLKPDMDRSGALVYLEGTPYTILASPEGYFSIPAPGPGTYTLVAYRPGYLQREVQVELTDQFLSMDLPEEILLLTGDIRFSNEINLDDLMMLRRVYGVPVAENDFMARTCDLNRSQRVDLVDLVLLARNYTKVGYGGPKDIWVVTAGVPMQGSGPGDQYWYSDFWMDLSAGDQIVLSSRPDGTGDLLVDDYLHMEVYTCDEQGNPISPVGTWDLDFMGGGNPVCLAPQAVPMTLGAGRYRFCISLINTTGYQKYSHPLYLTVQHPV
jgi:hypothetical protein